MDLAFTAHQTKLIIATELRVSYMKKPLTMTARGVSFGAGEMNRTPDLLITNELLYRLSYTGLVREAKPLIIVRRFSGRGNR